MVAKRVRMTQGAFYRRDPTAGRVGVTLGSAVAANADVSALALTSVTMMPGRRVRPGTDMLVVPLTSGISGPPGSLQPANAPPTVHPSRQECPQTRQDGPTRDLPPRSDREQGRSTACGVVLRRPSAQREGEAFQDASPSLCADGLKDPSHLPDSGDFAAPPLGAVEKLLPACYVLTRTIRRAGTVSETPSATRLVVAHQSAPHLSLTSNSAVSCTAIVSIVLTGELKTVYCTVAAGR